MAIFRPSSTTASTPRAPATGRATRDSHSAPRTAPEGGARSGGPDRRHAMSPRPPAALVTAGRRIASFTAPLRMLPTFLVVGTKRGGSTSLYRYIVEHPHVVPASVFKGTHYFDKGYPLGWAWYRSRFPIAIPGRRHALTGEGRPYYMFHPLALERIHARLPDAKLLCVLREPIERAFSHWNYEVQRGFEQLSFQAAVEAEEGRLAGEAERMREDERYISFAHRHHSYLARSRYAEQIERIRALFPPTRLLVIQSESLFADPPQQLERVYDFLGLPPWRGADHPPHKQRHHAPVPDQARDLLAGYFEPWNARLYNDPAVDFRWPR